MESQIQKDEEVSLKDLILTLQEWWRHLLTNWLIILVAGLIGGGCGLIYSYSKKPVYVAELTFVLEDDQQSRGAGGYASIAGQFGIDVGAGGDGGGIFAGDNLLALMKSRSLIEKALLTSINEKGKQQTLIEFYIDVKKMREKNSAMKGIRFLPGANSLNFSPDQNNLVKSFYNSIISDNLYVDKKDKKSDIISVQVTSENELFSKYFAEALVKVVSDFYIETKTKKSAENLAILQHQTDSVKRAFNSAIGGVAASTDATPNPNPLRQRLKVSSRSKEFDVQVNQTILSQLIPSLEAAKISLRKEKPLIQEIDRPVLPLDKRIYSKLRGFILGGILGGFIAVFLLLSRKFYMNVMSK